MSIQTVDCPEVVGKMVKSLKLYSTDTSVAEIVLEFTDGTSFSTSHESRVTTKAALVRTGIGAPEVIKNYIE